MGAVAKLLSSTFLSAFRGGAGRAVGSTALKTEGAAIREAWESATRTGGEKVVAGVAEKSGSFLGRAWKWIRGNPIKTTVGAGGAVAGAESYKIYNSWKDKLGGYLPFALIGGALAGGYLLLTGKDKKPEGSAVAADAPQALTPEEQLMQPQIAMPLAAPAPAAAVGSTVTASYPAAVGTVAPQLAQAAPPPTTNWQERVSRPQAPTVTMKPQESYLATEHARAEAAATAQNGVA